MQSTISEIYLTMFTEYPDVLNIEQFCEMIGGVSLKTGYMILQRGEVDYLKTGRAYKIPKINVMKYLKII